MSHQANSAAASERPISPRPGALAAKARLKYVACAAASVIGLAAHLLIAGQPAQPAAQSGIRPVSAYIDAHIHLDKHDPESVRAAFATMNRQHVTKVFALVPPYTSDDPERYTAEVLLAIAKQHPGKLAVVGGGGSLNAMIQDAVRAGKTDPELQRKFTGRAEELIREGVAGFGELTTEHFPSPGSSTYQYAPADHPLLLLLADIAARHRVPLVLHMEAVPQDMPLPSNLKSPPNPPRLHANIAALERLLDHNRSAKIIWAHAGSDNTGYRTPELCRRLLRTHSNLYMEIKIDPVSPARNPPIVDGKIKPEWLRLYKDFPGRFVIGSDQHYPAGNGPQRWEAAVQLLNQLPPDLRDKIGMRNAVGIYNAKAD